MKGFVPTERKRNFRFHSVGMNPKPCSFYTFQQRQSAEGLSWHQVLETVKREARDVPKDTVTGALKELPIVARDIGILKFVNCSSFTQNHFHVSIVFNSNLLNSEEPIIK